MSDVRLDGGPVQEVSNTPATSPAPSVATSPLVGRGLESRVKTGQNVAEVLDTDLFDRIINLRLVFTKNNSQDPPRTLTIRSDYEIRWGADGSYQYVDCVQKPSITVRYTPIPGSLAINVTIDIINLFTEEENMFYAAGDKITMVELQLGYKGQFPNWTKSSAEGGWADRPVEDFYALSEFDDELKALPTSFRTTSTKMLVTVLNTERLSLPPDMGLRIVGTTATLDQGLRWAYTDDHLRAYLEKRRVRGWLDREPVNQLPEIFFNLVTRRFVRADQRHSVYTKEAIGQALTPEQRNDPQYEQITKQDYTVVIFDKEYNVEKTLILDDDGAMQFDDANQYGVVVVLSDRLWDTPLAELPRWGLDEKDLEQAEPAAEPLMPTQQSYLLAQLKAIQYEFPYIRYFQLANGDYYAYHVADTSEMLREDTFTQQQQIDGVIQIPAVYDITWGPICHIRCPFFSIVSPMTTVAFQARYSLSDIVEFFTRQTPSLDFFLVLIGEVEFSTTGKENMMKLTCVFEDDKGKFIFDTSGAPIRVQTTQDIVEPQRQRNKIWLEKKLLVVDFAGNDDDTAPKSFAAIAGVLLNSAQEYSARWMEEKGTMPTLTDAIVAIKDWNPTLFSDTRLRRIPPVEKWIEQQTGVTVPVLYSASYQPPFLSGPDTVNLRLPFLPSYRDDERIT